MSREVNVKAKSESGSIFNIKYVITSGGNAWNQIETFYRFLTIKKSDLTEIDKQLLEKIIGSNSSDWVMINEKIHSYLFKDVMDKLKIIEIKL